jgi:hypothetical protein
MQPKTIRSMLTVAVLATASGALQAQSTDARRSPSIIHVQVADSLGKPIDNAEVSLMRGLKTVVASGRTNEAGQHEFIVDLDSTDYSVVARKIGYARGDRFVAVEKNAVDALVTMRQLESNSLPTVTVTARDLKRESYHIDADEIASTKVPVNDALDILYRLRPDMLVSRSGSWSGKGGVCPPLSNVWVNGKRYLGAFTISDPFVVARMRAAGKGVQRIGGGNMTILSEIAPEHISEMNYRDCFETNMKKVGSNNAIFITLKPGVDYSHGRGTFVVGDTVVVAARKN